MGVREILHRLRNDWAVSKVAIHHGQPTPLLLKCTIDATPALEEPLPQMPIGLNDFWQSANTARLFEDAEYGQWGLALVSPSKARELTKRFRKERPTDYALGDLVIGEFLGDSDVLLVRCDPGSADFGSLLIALPIDSRDGWYRIAENFESFLERYEQAQGAKYWEAD